MAASTQEQQRPAAPAVRVSSRLHTLEEEQPLPVYVALDEDVLRSSTSKTANYEALRAGLKAMQLVGVTGVAVELFWGAVECSKPQQYDWSAYQELLALIRDEGFTIQVVLCFHSNDHVQLPGWVLDVGLRNPDIYFTDRAGNRSLECVTFGVDDVPALAGRSAVAVYKQFLQSFQDTFASWLGTTITDVVIGLGPGGELRYPSQPRDRRWNFPGIGEFQCYDKYLLATLKACCVQVNQPSWGLGGPHDAGNYCLWPHQTGFFHQHGNWTSPYGQFFLQWYSEMMVRHADLVLAAVAPALHDAGVRVHAKLPNIHWWYGTASHAPECTAGYFNTASRDGYLPVVHVLADHGVVAQLRASEQRSAEAYCEPERLLALQRTATTALHVPVSLASGWPPRYDDQALSRLEGLLFEPGVSQGIELSQIRSLVFHRLSDTMFEPGNWARVKGFLTRVRDKAATLVVPRSDHSASCSAGSSSCASAAHAVRASSGHAAGSSGGPGSPGAGAGGAARALQLV